MVGKTSTKLVTQALLHPERNYRILRELLRFTNVSLQKRIINNV